MADSNSFEEFTRRRQEGLAELAAAATPERRNRATRTVFLKMLVVAIFFDGFQALLLFIPILGWLLSAFISIIAWLTFYLMNTFAGWGFSDTLKKMLANWFLPMVELVPILNVIPVWSARVIINYSIIKADDALYNASGGRVDLEKIATFKKTA